MTFSLEKTINSDLKLECQTVQQLCCLVDTPRSLMVWLLIEHCQWEQISNLSLDPSGYEDHRKFADDYLVTEILRKSPNLPLGIDRRARALDAFLNAELGCWFSNIRFSDEPKPDWVGSFERELSLILGPLDGRALRNIEERCHFGPGASTGVRGVGSVASDKFDKPLHMTADLYPFFKSILGQTWWEHQKGPKEIVEGNRFTTVPKNAKTDRGICVEPTLNMYVQLGVGSYIRSRLKRFQVDLTDQSRNQKLAQQAYEASLATIDLAMASDSLSWGLIVHFFPEPWQKLLLLLRSPTTKLPDGDSLELGKLSSMGNGFTFELESLVFYALVRTLCPRKQLENCSVYGDDIIVPQNIAEKLIEALNYLGFRVNGDKSFLAGSFYESCGADFFHGFNVRPFYLKGSENDIPYRLQIANALRAYARRRGYEEYCDSRFRPLWTSLIRKVPKAWRSCRVPPTFGDCGIIVSESELVSRRSPEGGHQGLLVRYHVLRPKKVTLRSLGVLLQALARTDGRSGRNWVDIPGPPNPPDTPFTKGRQTVRGLFGKPVTKTATVFWWQCGWDWLAIS